MSRQCLTGYPNLRVAQSQCVTRGKRGSRDVSPAKPDCVGSIEVRLHIRARVSTTARPRSEAAPSRPKESTEADMAATFAPNAALGARVSLRAPYRCASRKALAAPARVACKARALTTRAVKEVAGADFQAEVLDVRVPPSLVVRVGRPAESTASPRGHPR